MIIELKHDAKPAEIEELLGIIRQQNRYPKLVNGLEQTVLLVDPASGRGPEQLELFSAEPSVDDLFEAPASDGRLVLHLVLRLNAAEEEERQLENLLRQMGYHFEKSCCDRPIVVIPVEDDQSLETYNMLRCVADVIPAGKRYKLASREYCRHDSIVKLGRDRLIGGGHFQMIAGPCAVESLDQMRQAAAALIACGVGVIRGGAFKPRTSPYDFQGLGLEGLKILQQIKEEFGVAVTTEAVSVENLKELAAVADCIQIGARNCQNYNLLERVADQGRPVLLKRGMATQIEEWFSAAEYLMANGCMQVILCERGIKTFESSTRNTLDLSAVVAAKRDTHLPVVVDPSHAAGRVDMIPALSRAAIAAGADGLIVESHPNPKAALSDNAQQIPCADFGKYLASLQPVLEAMAKLRS